MKVFLDDVRPTPEGWTRCYSVNEFINLLKDQNMEEVEEISLDHDLGDYSEQGGDGVKAVLWMAEYEKWPRKVTVHSMNPVGRDNMLSLIRTYGPY